MTTKKEIEARLDELDIEYSSSSTKAELKALLPVEEPALVEEVVEEPEGSREERWERFLEAAQAQNPVKFQQKKERGKFDTIPPSFR